MMHFKFVVLVIIPMIACEHHYVQHHDDNLLNRFERAAEVTKIPVNLPANPPINTPAKTPGITATMAPVNSQKKSTIPEVVQRHMMLGRTFNALYLQNQLANNKIDYSDVIAGVWNLKDKTVIDKISSLKVNGLSGSLAKLEANIKADSIDGKKKVDVVAIEEKMKAVGEITGEMRNHLVESVNRKTLPIYIREGLEKYGFIRQLSYDFGKAAIRSLRRIGKSQLREVEVMDFQHALNLLTAFLTQISKSVKTIKEDTGNLDTLIQGVEAAEKVKMKIDDFTALSNLLQETDIILESVNHMSDGVNFESLKQSINQLNVIIQAFSQGPPGVPIGIAFLKDRNLSKVEADWQTEWMRQLLNNGTTLGPLSNALLNFKDLAQKFQPINNNMTAWFKVEMPERISRIADLVGAVQQNFEINDKFNPKKLASCLVIPPEEDPSLLPGISDLSESLKVFVRGVTDIGSILEKTKTKETVNKLDGLQTKISAHKTETLTKFEAWVNSTGRQVLDDTAKLLEGLSKDVFSKLKRDQTFIDAVTKVSEAKENVEKVQAWLGGINIAKPECNALFSFKPAELTSLNDVPPLITLVKTQSDISHLKPLVDSIPKVSVGLKQLKSRETKDDDDDKSPVQFETSNPQNLLDAASSFRSLEVMEEIHRSDKAIETILKRGEIAKKKVESDLELKKKFEGVWNGFDGLKATLTTLQAGIKKALAKIPLTGDGGSFEEIRQVYTSISTSPITTTPIQLQDYRRSLMEFSDSGSWKDLEEAFAKLERPVSTDFKLSYVGFTKMPQVLKSLEDELEELFQSEDNDKKGGRKPTLCEANGLYCIIGGLTLLLLIAAIVCLFMWWLENDRNEARLEENTGGIPMQRIANDRVMEPAEAAEPTEVPKRKKLLIVFVITAAVMMQNAVIQCFASAIKNSPKRPTTTVCFLSETLEMRNINAFGVFFSNLLVCRILVTIIGKMSNFLWPSIFHILLLLISLVSWTLQQLQYHEDVMELSVKISLIYCFFTCEQLTRISLAILKPKDIPLSKKTWFKRYPDGVKLKIEAPIVTVVSIIISGPFLVVKFDSHDIFILPLVFSLAINACIMAISFFEKDPPTDTPGGNTTENNQNEEGSSGERLNQDTGSILEAGADKEINDHTEDSADIWADELGQAELFNEYHALWKTGNQPWRTLPSIPRPWNILVFDNKQFPKRLRRKLPLRIKRNTKWGYKPGMDLNEFTHIIVPDDMEYDENTLKMSDDNLMTFKLLGCAANLVSVDWFYRLTDYPKDAKKYMDEDYDCYLHNTHYNGQTHTNAVYFLKTRIHRMLPPLLSEVKIHFLPTKDKKALKAQAEWKEIITLFGGTCPDKITGDTYWEAGPYWSMEWNYVHEDRERQNKPWILYYPDSDMTKREWKKERVEGKTGRWTVAPFRFLPECLARNFLLGMAQKIVPVVEDEVFGDDSEGQHLEDSVTSISTTSTTTDAGKTPITTGANNTAATATQSVSGTSTTSTVGDAAPTQSKMEQAKRTRNRLLKGRDIVKGPNGRNVISKESAVQPPTSKFGASKEPAHAPDGVKKTVLSKSKMSAEPPSKLSTVPTSRMLPPARIAPEK
ncbi:hypothetical protein CAEBREN_04094 [Caenorhabditis brenneri]|uniref:Domain of unknown function WSN domain-containing protein n=1 Tax=Caenorhabditis brenneri TaxID=135651 RepID=G0NIM0_CAEBE|nr:hypothetical protein CAEBREN_04094 [Caenorhabditis brenneri]